MKTFNRKMRDAMRPIRNELRHTPKRVIVHEARLKEEDSWLGFVRSQKVIPLKQRK